MDALVHEDLAEIELATVLMAASRRVSLERAGVVARLDGARLGVLPTNGRVTLELQSSGGA